MAIGACDPCGCAFEECECLERGDRIITEFHEPRTPEWALTHRLFLVGDRWSSKPSFRMQP